MSNLYAIYADKYKAAITPYTITSNTVEEVVTLFARLHSITLIYGNGSVHFSTAPRSAITSIIVEYTGIAKAIRPPDALYALDKLLKNGYTLV